MLSLKFVLLFHIQSTARERERERERVRERVLKSLTFLALKLLIMGDDDNKCVINNGFGLVV